MERLNLVGVWLTQDALAERMIGCRTPVAVEQIGDTGDGNPVDLPPATGPVGMLVHCRFLSQAGRLA